MPTTTSPHKLATIANNHGLIGLGPYTTGALRRAAVLTSTDVGKVAQQTDTDPATFWMVMKVAAGAGTWTRIDTGAEVLVGAHPGLLVTSAAHVGLYDAEFKTVATGVSQLTDQSAAGKHLVQATVGKQPIWTASDATINNKPRCRFDGTDDELVCSSLSMGLGKYMMAVIASRVDGSMWGGSTNQSNSFFSLSSGQLAAYNGSGALTSAAVIGLGVWVLCEIWYDGSGAGIMHATWNNSTGNFSQTTWTAGAGSDTSWGIGSRAGGSYGGLDFANLSIFASKPSAPEIAALRAALISRYALPFS